MKDKTDKTAQWEEEFTPKGKVKGKNGPKSGRRGLPSRSSNEDGYYPSSSPLVDGEARNINKKRSNGRNAQRANKINSYYCLNEADPVPADPVSMSLSPLSSDPKTPQPQPRPQRPQRCVSSTE